MTHIQRDVDHLNITIKEDNNIGKVSFYLPNLNRTYLPIFYKLPIDNRVIILLLNI